MTSRVRIAAAALTVAVLSLAACSSDNTGSKNTVAPAATSATTGGGSGGTATTSGSSPSAVTRPASTGPADNSLSPVVVGVDNLESSAASFKSTRIGFQQGAQYVNEQLGGINGHPLKADVCKVDLAPASSVTCANNWVQNKVVANVQGVNPNAPSLLPILQGAGISIIVPAPQNAQFNSAVGEAFSVLPSAFEYYVDTLVAMKNEGLKKVALVSPLEQPGVQEYVDLGKAVGSKLGLDITVVTLPQVVNDYTAFAATVLASSPEGVVVPTAADSICDGLLPAIRKNGFQGPVFLSACTHFAQILPPEQVNNAMAFVTAWLPAIAEAAPADIKADVDIFTEYMAKQSEIKESEYDIAWYGFFTAVTAADMLRQVNGDVTAASVKAELPKVKGRIFLNGLPYDCSGTAWPNTTACSKGVQVLKWGADGKAALTSWSPVDPTAYYDLAK
ncbi:MAG: ABC transporter substrate-binding protein [Ilumatobacteraceae bacterium]